MLGSTSYLESPINTTRSALKDFKKKTELIIQEKVKAPTSIETIGFLENWQQMMEEKK